MENLYPLLMLLTTVVLWVFFSTSLSHDQKSRLQWIELVNTWLVLPLLICKLLSVYSAISKVLLLMVFLSMPHHLCLFKDIPMQIGRHVPMIEEAPVVFVFFLALISSHGPPPSNVLSLVVVQNWSIGHLLFSPLRSLGFSSCSKSYAFLNRTLLWSGVIISVLLLLQLTLSSMPAQST